jgi:dolichol-phosphate mannosyltransferase
LEEGYGCAFGSRFSNPERVEGYPPVKRILNRLGNRLIAWVAGRAYDDYTNGFKGGGATCWKAFSPWSRPIST